MNTKKENISNLAHKFGFDLIGFASAKPLISQAQNLNLWLTMGYNANMKFFLNTIEKRQNIKNILPDAKTVIMLAVNYYNQHNHSEINPRTQGKIARFAWGKDYHLVISNMLEKLTNNIKVLYPEAQTIYYVDTGPIMEKPWAQTSGIGWQGKNSLIITKEYGSWVFLATIVTNLEIEPDLPAKNLCGSCNICIKNCPTNAIAEHGILNANKCIAYWTIEDKTGLIPNEIIQNLNGWLFGCDICQQVCPYNLKPKPTQIPEFKTFYHTSINFSDILDSSNRQFKLSFKDTPLERRKLELIKNIIKKIM